MTPLRWIAVTSLMLVSGAGPVFAQSKAADLARVTLEDLMKVEITSAARREQAVESVPAAVFVITQDDIRRSGFRSLPDLFRLVPGMQVAQLNANKWAVAVRGFNDVFSDKLLVLIDGRSIYKRSFSGVFWHAEDLVLEDIERIEIIRGAGGAIWGANAMNGVINIITKSAAATQGGRVQIGAGTQDPSSGSARYGGRIGGTSYRAYGLWSDHGAGLADSGGSAGDDWSLAKTGFRADWEGGRHSVMLQGGLLDGDQHALWVRRSPVPGAVAEIDPSRSQARAGDILGRWSYAYDSGAFLQAQSFYSRQTLREPLETETEDVTDVDLAYHSQPTHGHNMILGGGYRRAGHTDNGGSFTFSLRQPRDHNQIVNLFAQDEVSLGSRVAATIGTKLEHDTTAGWNVLPTARVLWDIVPGRQHVWAAVSKAVRTPSLTDLAVRLNFGSFDNPDTLPVVAGLIGNPEFRNQRLISSEAGYRLSLGDYASIDVATFRGNYKALTTSEPRAPVFEATPAPAHIFVYSQLSNLLDADTAGVEVSGNAMPVKGWKVDGSMTGFRLTAHADRSLDPLAAAYDGNAPAWQWQLHSSLNVGARAELDAGLYHTGRLETAGIAPYTRVDARLQFALTPQLSISAVGQNLLDAAHAEFSVEQIQRSLVRRNAYLRLTWQF